MISLVYLVLVTFAALVGIGMAIDAVAERLWPSRCESCRRLTRSHIRKLRKEPKLPLPRDRVHRTGGRR